MSADAPRPLHPAEPGDRPATRELIEGEGGRPSSPTPPPQGEIGFISLDLVRAALIGRAAGKISPAALAVAVSLASFINETSGEAWPSVISIGRRAGMGERQTRRLLRELDEAAVIEITPARGRSHTCLYKTGQARPLFSETRQARPLLNPGKPDKSNPKTGQSESDFHVKPVGDVPRTNLKRTKEEPIRGRERKNAPRSSPPDPRVKEFINWYFRRHQELIGAALVVAGGKDGALVKLLLGSLELAELKRRAEGYLADRDKYASDKAISKLAARINDAKYSKPDNRGGENYEIYNG